MKKSTLQTIHWLYEQVKDQTPDEIYAYMIRRCPKELRYVKTGNPKDEYRSAINDLVNQLRKIQKMNEENIIPK